MIYDQVREDYVRSYFNTGDMMVYDSTLKLLDFADVDVLKIANPTEADIERYNSEFDYAFLRGSNFIHEHMQWEKAIWVLERLTIPVHAIGVGAQAEKHRAIELSAESKRVWKLISERTRAIGVRGGFSAEVLSQNGVTNVEVVGCPSLFRKRDRNLRLNLRLSDEIRKVAFSLRRETSHYYAIDTRDFTQVQKKLLLRVANAYDTTVTIHGEPPEKAYFVQDKEGMAKADVLLRQQGWFDPESEPALKAIYNHRLFLNDRVEDYDSEIVKYDTALGYRVHGILPALANSVPGLMVNYDSRSAELAETFSIPTVSAEDALQRPFAELFGLDQFSSFQKSFTSNYDRMKNYIQSLGAATRM
ncbi:polysaccharide pyruvyl transferase family protein [Tianweitania sediminis]|uniref:Polysaccharide pyruvyl transferase family protein n=1 Tax=Tianweitania sediminis TaxID=1502156 RepID=A0A8J7R1Y9_9HYPH|nr:polysaccharide pyruvyl transferase family protein [Tianweitania sediminis]MBP0441368.1 polysaccharide pyruvyl transferase family protein [Tianweitania sediminis]